MKSSSLQFKRTLQNQVNSKRMTNLAATRHQARVQSQKFRVSALSKLLRSQRNFSKSRSSDSKRTYRGIIQRLEARLLEDLDMIRDPQTTATIILWVVMSSLPPMFTMCTLRLTDRRLMVNSNTQAVLLPILYRITTIILVNVSSLHMLQDLIHRPALARESQTVPSIDLHLRRSRLILTRLQKPYTLIPSPTTTIKSSVNSSSSLMPAKATSTQSPKSRKLYSNNSFLLKRAILLRMRLLVQTRPS